MFTSSKLNILLVAMIGLVGAGPQRQISCAECKHEMHHFGSVSSFKIMKHISSFTGVTSMRREMR